MPKRLPLGIWRRSIIGGMRFWFTGTRKGRSPSSRRLCGEGAVETRNSTWLRFSNTVADVSKTSNERNACTWMQQPRDAERVPTEGGVWCTTRVTWQVL
mmetsp:Transcript_7928/g.19325  ORF Transcript_7928/g.19325 Transcript_7928/m.19325 type:complete len:99 (+) Transcript_7928:1772-2068(+)